jgi:hypothetical protein
LCARSPGAGLRTASASSTATSAGNILLDGEGHALLADFARQFSTTKPTGTV